MIDPVQAVLLVVIILLSLLLLVLGVQVFFILKELRNTLSRATRVLQNTESITESVSEPMSLLSGLFLSAKSLSTISKILKKIRDHDGDE
jgi:predicted PurR-regulated permease PerM